MTITWINCAERMPPDDMDDVIARWTITNKTEICLRTGEGMNHNDGWEG